MHTSASVVDHFGGGASGSKDPSFMFFYQERNRLMNFLLFFSGKFIVKYIPVLIMNFFLKSAASVVSNKYSFMSSKRSMLVDVIASTVMWAITGALIAMAMGMGSKKTS